MNYKLGSQWNKWDLHVHTPSSIIQHFGSNDEATWEIFIRDLENLPPEFKVLGINDYLFIDGYERLLNEKTNKGRLSNIDLLLPVIEFRIEKLAGIDFGTLKRINLHIIFSNEVSVENIKSQFLNTLHQSYILESGQEWNRAITKESIEELGKQISDGIPQEKRSSLGSNLKIGFNNLNVKEDQIFTALKRDCFKCKYLIAVGKTEWADLKWSDSSIAVKKTIINQADIVFTAAQTVNAFQNAKNKLKEQGVKDLLLDCSDAHYLSSSVENERIGNCFSWIKADTTFEGLKQIIYEPKDRVKIQDSNPILDKKKLIIESLEIRDSNKYIIPDVKVHFNRDLVCIIGPRGSGKSALLETIAFNFGTHLQNNQTYSLIPYYQNIGADANISLQYKDLDGNSIELYETSLKEPNEAPCSYPFLYINQNQIEILATDKQYLHSLAFDTISKNSTFTERMVELQDTIDNLIKKIEDNLNNLINQNVLMKSFNQKLLEIETDKLKKELKLIESESTRELLSELNIEREKKNLIDQAKVIKEEISQTLSDTQISIQNNLFELYTLLEQLNISYTEFEIGFLELESYLNDVNDKLIKIENDQEYQKKISDLKLLLTDKIDVSVEHIEAVRNKIALNESSIKSFDKEKDKYSNLLKVRSQLLKKLNTFFIEYEIAYKSAVQEFSDANRDILGQLELEAVLIFNTDKLIESLLHEYVDKRKIKTVENLRKYLELPENINYETFIKWIDDFFIIDFDINNYDAIYPTVKNDFEKLFTQNHPRLSTKIKYKLGGVTKEIDQLSIGQKGTILLKLFLSTGNNCPIIIDQPEDHLDNTFIYHDLVQTIRNAKQRRQIIVATHNANLVVNGDAEQVIVANYEEEQITYLASGSLENPIIKEKVISILEGGIEAFRKREQKY
jgi:ABC-type lipoprotein export system ATPase subunit